MHATSLKTWKLGNTHPVVCAAQVSSEEAIDMARRLATEEGIFCGISSGVRAGHSLQLSAISGSHAW